MRLIPQITNEKWKEENKDLFPFLRIYGTSDKNVTPQRQENGYWKNPAAYNIFGFSPGIANHFAIELCRKKKIPVGIVHVSSIYAHWIDEYLPPEDFVKDSVLAKTKDAKKLAYRVSGTEECKKINAERISYMEKYLNDSMKRNSEGKTVLHPDFPQYPKWAKSNTGIMYNGAISPLLPLAVKGVIYKDPDGKNPFDAKNHDAKLELLVKSFRKWFDDPNIPVFLIQDKARNNQNTIRTNTKFASQQKLIQKDGGVEIVVANDIETFPKPPRLFLKTIPRIGERVYSLAARKVYGNKSIDSETPKIIDVKREKGKIVILFSMPLKTFDGLAPDGFAVRAEGQKVYRSAKAELKDNMVILSAPGVDKPDEASYCYLNSAIKKTPNLTGKNEMPVAAFSTEYLIEKGDK
jgi:hypothetical protein